MGEDNDGLKLNLNLQSDQGKVVKDKKDSGNGKDVARTLGQGGDAHAKGGGGGGAGGGGGSGGGGGGKSEIEGEFISSLFNHNPEIPSIQQGEVTAPTEQVFSVRTFDQLNLDPHLVKNLAEMGISTLTTIQSKALPVIMGGKDALVKSQTGSGKTLTYALPILQVKPFCFLVNSLICHYFAEPW